VATGGFEPPAHRHPSVVKDTRSFRAGGRQGIRTRTRELWRLRCFRYTTLPTSLHATDFFKGTTSLRPRPALTRGLPAKTRKAFRGSPQKAWFSMNAGPLGRFALLGALERAAVMASDPRLCHGSAHTLGDSLEAGQVDWPRHR
jgi:hypothetical protein